MRPKQVADFRPIANIRLFYKVFACLVLDRIEHQLDDHQPEEQHGFRRGKRIEEHLLTANVFLDKALDVGIPVWVVILDLSKAFDQDVPPCYCTLLWTLYKGQTGSVHGSERFNIERGVKQGDVISPILFNAGLEHVMPKWKAELVHHGVQFGHGSRLTRSGQVRSGLYAKGGPVLGRRRKK